MRKEPIFKLDTLQGTKNRRRQRVLKLGGFYSLLGIFVGSIIVNILGGSAVHGSWIPVTLLVGLFVIALWADLYFESPKRFISPELINQEVEWLFGKDSLNSLTPLELVFAQERIRKRRAGRWRFLILSIPFLTLEIFLLFLATTFLRYKEHIAGVVILAIGLLLLLLIFYLFVSAFPTKWMLARYESRALKDLAQEVYARYSLSLKPDVWYKMSYDGELIEVSKAELLQIAEWSLEQKLHRLEMMRKMKKSEL